MKTVYILMHKPSFFSISPDTLVAVFENEDDANEALRMRKSELRKPCIKSVDVVDADAWELKKQKERQPSGKAVSGDGSFDYYGAKYGRPSYGPGSTRSKGGGYR